MLAMAIDGAFFQAFYPGQDGPFVAAFGKFEADSLLDSLAFDDGGLELIIDLDQIDLILSEFAG